MDTLKGEWAWFYSTGGIMGAMGDNRYKSVIKVLGQNPDSSINYEVWVRDTLFTSIFSNHYDEVFLDDTLWSQGSFKIQYPSQLWGEKVANIKLPHWSPNGDYLISFKNADTLYFWDCCIDGCFYFYKRIK